MSQNSQLKAVHQRRLAENGEGELERRAAKVKAIISVLIAKPSFTSPSLSLSLCYFVVSARMSST